MYKARRTTLNVTYKGVNISKEVNEDLVNFSFTDNESSKADDIEITLQDRDGKWSREWFPNLGDKIEAQILYESDGRISYLDCGSFTLDEFTSGSGSNGTQVAFKATSLPQNNTVRRTQKNRAWEGARLSEIAKDVADTGQLRLTYATDIDPIFERREQINKSDLGFLEYLVNEVALSLKVTKDQIVIFNREDLERKEPLEAIVLGTDDIKEWSFTTQSSDTYSESTVEYKDTKTGKVIKATEKDESVKNGKVIKKTQRVENAAEAQRIAKANLNKKNRKKVTGSISILGDIRFIAGSIVPCVGFGQWDGSFYADTVTHNISASDGYTTSLELSSTSNPKEDTSGKTIKAKNKAEKSKKIVKTTDKDKENLIQRNKVLDYGK